MKSHKIGARTFGIFLLLALVSYGLGSGLIGSIVDTSDSLVNINANKSQLTVNIQHKVN